MRRGFTIIEVLVVIAILALLSALLFPVFSGARKSALNTADVSRMKQLAEATHLYAGDFGDLVPPGATDMTFLNMPDAMPDGFRGIEKPWATIGDLLFPYTKSEALFRQSTPPKGRTLPSPHLSSDFFYDEWAGFRLKSWQEIEGKTTMFYPDVEANLDRRTARVPCMSWDFSVRSELINACEGRTTWWHD